MYSSDEEDTLPPDQAAPSIASIDSRIEQALSQPELDTFRGPGFPDVPPLNLNYNPDPEAAQSRRENLPLNACDESFIKESMSALTIAPPPWAAAVEERNWKEELRKHLADD